MAQLDDIADLKARTEEALRRKDYAAAVPLLEQVIALEGDRAEPLGALAYVLASQGRGSESIGLLERAVAAEPDHGATRAMLADALKAEQHFAKALDHLREIPGHESDFQLQAQEADLLGKLGRHDEEIALYRKLIERNEALPGLRVSLARALIVNGERDEAIAVLRDAVGRWPEHGRAWWMLSELKDYRFSDSELAAMQGALEAASRDEDRTALNFALGKALDNAGDHAAAFRHYADGNALDAQRNSAPNAQLEASTRRVVAAYDHGFFERHAGQGNPSDAPIFVVGLQRSGSTLVEQILASHSQIEGTAELPALPQVARELLADTALAPGDVPARLDRLGADELRRLGELYLERAAPYRTSDKPRFIDKLPSNWRRLGLIRTILPNARIIDARRHPMAVGWSNFTQLYGGGTDFVRDLGAFGRYYRAYLDQMDHFEAVQPGSVHRVLNERLVDDFETEVRRLLEFVGVGFEPACLAFHETERAVRTPSAEQVRRPINRDGVDRWRNYQPFLGELEIALGDALQRWDR
jgi:tetratricopeptide (TPR) repeat protein